MKSEKSKTTSGITLKGYSEPTYRSGITLRGSEPSYIGITPKHYYEFIGITRVSDSYEPTYRSGITLKGRSEPKDFKMKESSAASDYMAAIRSDSMISHYRTQSKIISTSKAKEDILMKGGEFWKQLEDIDKHLASDLSRVEKIRATLMKEDISKKCAAYWKKQASDAFDTADIEQYTTYATKDCLGETDTPPSDI